MKTELVLAYVGMAVSLSMWAYSYCMLRKERRERTKELIEHLFEMEGGLEDYPDADNYVSLRIFRGEEDE